MRNGVEERLEQALAEEDEKLSVAYEQRARLDQQIVASLTVVKRLKAIRDGGFVGSETVNTNGNGKKHRKDKRFHGKRDAIITAATSIRDGGGTWPDALEAVKKLGYKASVDALQKLVNGRPTAPRTKKAAAPKPEGHRKNASSTRVTLLDILKEGAAKAHDLVVKVAERNRLPLKVSAGRVSNELSLGVKKKIYRRVEDGIYALPE